ncbi:MAG: hypothetical protein WC505_07745 [Patescibacteria group bacterium]
MTNMTSRKQVTKEFELEDLVGTGSNPYPIRLLLPSLTAAVEQATQEGFTELYFVPGSEGDYYDDVEACLIAHRWETDEEQQAREAMETKAAEKDAAYKAEMQSRRVGDLADKLRQFSEVEIANAVLQAGKGLP